MSTGKKSNLNKPKKVIGLVEPVRIIGKKRSIETIALLDTGATRSSIDLKTASRAGLGPITSVTRVKSQTEPRGYIRRAVVTGKVEISGKTKKAHFTLADRIGMRYRVLIGRDVLHSDFIVDIERTHNGYKLEDLKKNVERKNKDIKN